MSGSIRRVSRYMRIMIMACMIMLSVSLPINSASAAPSIDTNARAAALIDVTSGRLLYSSNGDTPMRIASLTKIMTAIVAIEHGQLTDIVKTPKRAVGREGSSIYLQLGEEMTLHNMLYGLMLRSGNDAATAIAEHVGGSELGFVHLMNEKANMIGLKNSSFKNPHGLDEEDHYSSANDLATLSAYALRNPSFAEIVRTKEKQVPNPHDSWNYAWRNKNKMLTLYEGADGVKTGYTKKAFRCLVSSATRNGQQLAAVTINDGDDWNDHSRLLDWGFKHYPLQTVAEKGDGLTGYPFVLGQTFRYPFLEGEQSSLQTRVTLIDPLSTDYVLGERGRLEYQLQGVTVGAVPLFEPNSVRMGLVQ
ncbi:D-alanyl-D-alanine carboxypeptidase family protein [Paenibacillus sp. strain BS8-2]